MRSPRGDGCRQSRYRPRRSPQQEMTLYGRQSHISTQGNRRTRLARRDSCPAIRSRSRRSPKREELHTHGGLFYISI